MRSFSTVTIVALVLVSVLFSSCSATPGLRALSAKDSQVDAEESSLTLQERELADKHALVSYFTCVFDVANILDLSEVDLSEVLDDLVLAYNNLINSEFDDPYHREMEKVKLLDLNVRRELIENDTPEDSSLTHDGRRLFTITITVTVIGTCTGCSSNSGFSNQLSGRRELGGNSSSHAPYYRAPTLEEILDAYSEYLVEHVDPSSPILGVLDLFE